MSQTTPFAAAFAQANLPGAVGLIVDRDGIRHAEVLGSRDMSSSAPMELDNVTTAVLGTAILGFT